MEMLTREKKCLQAVYDILATRSRDDARKRPLKEWFNYAVKETHDLKETHR